jgi:CDP-glucose 4,6-dehydratase
VENLVDTAPANSQPDRADALFGGRFADRDVFVTGHTGFKGAWLCEWLLRLGARVHGYALQPPTEPALFEQLGLAGRMASHTIADVRNGGQVLSELARVQPDFVFHLAAQPLVRLSYRNPVETYEINCMGTVHVLEALRGLAKPCAAVMVTTDKCYENQEWLYGYRESDPLGGHDPYSSSKGMAELAIQAYRRSYFQEHPVRVASARAGNVIGGGDWAEDRILPDCIRALMAGRSIPVRNPSATRPWQHVLEPLSGYLWLGARLASDPPARGAARLDSAFNFGPGVDANQPVRALVEELLRHWPARWVDCSDARAPHEANLLQLSTDKARSLLNWMPVWRFAEAVRHTVEWYREATTLSGDGIGMLTARQIAIYESDAAEMGLLWTKMTPAGLPGR